MGGPSVARSAPAVAHLGSAVAHWGSAPAVRGHAPVRRRPEPWEAPDRHDLAPVPPIRVHVGEDIRQEGRELGVDVHGCGDNRSAMSTPPLVLASSSRWRAQILRETGIDVELCPSPADETSVQDADPVRLAKGRALVKALAVAALRPEAWVIGADQVAHLDGEPFGKPESPEDHLVRLRQLRGRTHRLTTALALVRSSPEGGPVVVEAFEEHTDITFRADLTEEELAAYVRSGEGSECAGGYRAEARGAQLIARVDGDWTNVIGLPIHRLVDHLRAGGWRPKL